MSVPDGQGVIELFGHSGGSEIPRLNILKDIRRL